MHEAESVFRARLEGLPPRAHRLEQAEGSHEVRLDEGRGAADRAVDVAFGGEVHHGARRVLAQDCLDERVSEALARAIRAELPRPRYSAYRVARRNRFLGRWLAHGEGYPDWSLRLFHRAHASWSNDEVHEAVLTTAEVGRLEGDLMHDSAEDIATYMEKQNRYTSLHAKALYDQGVRAGYWRLAASPVARFIKFYFLRRGFLDGGAGFAHIVIGCHTSFQKYVKLIELQHLAGDREPAARRGEAP